jgi:hypothetical protein
MPFFVRTEKVWPIGLGFVLLVILLALDALGADTLSSYIAFVVVFVTGMICVIAMLKDAFWRK